MRWLLVLLTLAGCTVNNYAAPPPSAAATPDYGSVDYSPRSQSDYGTFTAKPKTTPIKP